jgi:hypothetical protein
MCAKPKRGTRIQLDAWSQTLALLSKLSFGDEGHPGRRDERPGGLVRRLPLIYEPCPGAVPKVRILDATVTSRGAQAGRDSPARARLPGTAFAAATRSIGRARCGHAR